VLAVSEITAVCRGLAVATPEAGAQRRSGRATCIVALCLVLALAALTGCGRSAPRDPSADQAAIRAVSLAWKRAFNAGDAAAVTALYAEDAMLSAPAVPLVRGQALIGRYFQQQAAAFSRAAVTVVDAPLGEPGVSGDLGYQWETYQIIDKSGAVVDSGRLLTLFERRRGQWLIIGDTWNSDVAPAVRAPAAAGATTGSASE
jgi:ketosteroid isomerase-like protein